MSAAQIAAELASGGAYTAWFVVVVLAAVVVFLFKEVTRLNQALVEAYKEQDSEGIASVIKTQMEHTTILSTIMGILRGLTK